MIDKHHAAITAAANKAQLCDPAASSAETADSSSGDAKTVDKPAVKQKQPPQQQAAQPKQTAFFDFECSSTNSGDVCSALMKRLHELPGKLLFVSFVGSRRYNLDREGSDEDFLVVYAAPTEDSEPLHFIPLVLFSSCASFFVDRIVAVC